MTTLSIKDLARNEELTIKAMAGVHGGRRAPFFSIEVTKIDTDITKQSLKLDAAQQNLSSVEAAVQNGVGNAVFGGKFGGNLDADVDLTQKVDQDNDIYVTQRA